MAGATAALPGLLSAAGSAAGSAASAAAPFALEAGKGLLESAPSMFAQYEQSRGRPGGAMAGMLGQAAMNPFMQGGPGGPGNSPTNPAAGIGHPGIPEALLKLISMTNGSGR